MTLAPGTALGGRLRAYADLLRAKGAIRTEATWAAFASVERHRFIPSFYDRGPSRIPVGPDPDSGLLDRIYSDTALMTHLPRDEARGFSSASQPSLVAKMIEALQLSPGMRVLEIGTGTGYNSALIAAITAAPVVTVESSAAVAAEARAALEDTSADIVTVAHGDGYHGHAANSPYNRIIVTCGVTGISPHWPGQLTSRGLILAPTAHGGLHPVLAITADGSGSLRGRAVLPADFMTAAGPLYHWPGDRTPVPGQLIPVDVLATEPGAGPELDADRYQDLWFYLAARDRRITRAVTGAIDPLLGLCALHDPGTGTAWIQRDGTAYSAGARCVLDDLARHITGWDQHNRPPLDRWECSLKAASPRHSPVHIPARWQLD
jgi:protein-L-isoaspartate(D-aspartate) O-methyltransferase